LVGENTLIAEKTTIKNCVIGANCKIDEKVRLTNCIIMDNVTISALNNLTGSIICEGTDTCTNIELKDCIVSRGHHFSEGGNLNIIASKKYDSSELCVFFFFRETI
jgi:translation initiation factor eIF-2B subunit gamma